MTVINYNGEETVFRQKLFMSAEHIHFIIYTHKRHPDKIL